MLNNCSNLAVIILAALSLTSLQAQDYFRANLRVTCTSLESGAGRRTIDVVNNQQIIAQCAALGASQATSTLVYNPAADAIQVIDVNTGALICDVLQFQGGTWSTDGFVSQRLAFVFVPEQAEAIGTAIFRERVLAAPSGELNRVSISGNLQLALTGGLVLGGVSSGFNPNNFPNADGGLLPNVPNAGPAGQNVRICTGNFTITRRLVPGAVTPTPRVPQSPFAPFLPSARTFNTTRLPFNTTNPGFNTTTRVTPVTPTSGAIFGNQTANVAIGQQSSGIGQPTTVLGRPTGTGLQTSVAAPGLFGPTIGGFFSTGATFTNRNTSTRFQAGF